MRVRQIWVEWARVRETEWDKCVTHRHTRELCFCLSSCLCVCQLARWRTLRAGWARWQEPVHGCGGVARCALLSRERAAGGQALAGLGHRGPGGPAGVQLSGVLGQHQGACAALCACGCCWHRWPSCSSPPCSFHSHWGEALACPTWSFLGGKNQGRWSWCLTTPAPTSWFLLRAANRGHVPVTTAWATQASQIGLMRTMIQTSRQCGRGTTSSCLQMSTTGGWWVRQLPLFTQCFVYFVVSVCIRPTQRYGFLHNRKFFPLKQ